MAEQQVSEGGVMSALGNDFLSSEQSLNEFVSESRREICWVARRNYLEEAVAKTPYDHELWHQYQAFLEDLRRRGDL